MLDLFVVASEELFHLSMVLITPTNRNNSRQVIISAGSSDIKAGGVMFIMLGSSNTDNRGS